MKNFPLNCVNVNDEGNKYYKLIIILFSYTLPSTIYVSPYSKGFKSVKYNVKFRTVAIFKFAEV